MILDLNINDLVNANLQIEDSDLNDVPLLMATINIAVLKKFKENNKLITELDFKGDNDIITAYPLANTDDLIEKGNTLLDEIEDSVDITDIASSKYIAYNNAVLDFMITGFSYVGKDTSDEEYQTMICGIEFYDIYFLSF